MAESAKPAGVRCRCKRCGYGWEYRGSRIAEALSAPWPVYTSCPRCNASSVRVAPEGAAYQPGRARRGRPPAPKPGAPAP